MNKQTYEQIKFDENHLEDNGFYISVSSINGKEVSQKPLSAHELTKEFSCCLLVRRDLPNVGNLDEGETIPEIFLVPLKYIVKPEAKYVYLKPTTQGFENGAKVLVVMQKNVNNGQCQAVPVPSAMWNKDESEISITRGKSKLITLKEAANYLKSGCCLGIFSPDLSRKYTLGS